MVDVHSRNVKEQVENAAREVINKDHLLTFTEYKAVLTKFNIAAEEVKGSHYATLTVASLIQQPTMTTTRSATHSRQPHLVNLPIAKRWSGNTKPQRST